MIMKQSPLKDKLHFEYLIAIAVIAFVGMNSTRGTDPQDGLKRSQKCTTFLEQSLDAVQ
jgi:hypothetical protein